MKRLLSLTILTGALLAQQACTQEYLNPSAVSQQQAVSSVDGLIALCNGLQYRYTGNNSVSALYNAVAAGGLTTRELVVLNAGNVDEDNLSKGLGNVSNTNAVVRNLWTTCQLVRSNADIILANPGAATDAGVRSGVIGYASVFRALALGTLAQFFEQAPLTSGTNAPFVPRAQLLTEAVAQLETAATQLAAAPVSSVFTQKIVTGIDLPNTVQALIARYSLMAGNYDKALAAAAKVSLSSRSYFAFDDNTRNPIFQYAFGNRNVFEPANTALGLPAGLTPATGDGRIAFYIRSNPASTQNLGTGFYTANSAPIPVYLPGEILLIQAEAYARKNDLTNAVLYLNRVLTKTAASDAWGVGANLSAYAGDVTADAVLTEIYRNRQIELAFQGFRLEDSRRFGRSGPSATGERNRNFMPYPRTERDNNSSTPATDPN
ncbi:putative outer membrane starch-binding protein [Spirosoma oryzae]|uniref:Putative outer membrane starch-binding protein n=1 Tax=Spirosoma oryzae TaxID=1469603 RepID=A0A2T0S763_9BACT|nr:RagB/SusD family nutrient uptake outer membrane protein [Spirosoma oryzae]PRY29269.1 putative outer membrane starch-binding protein [Spirosoma oryzae]